MNMNVTTEHRTLSENHVVFDDAIMRNVGTRHKVTIAADSRIAVFFFRRSIDRYIFSNHVSITNDNPGFRAFVADILGLTTNHSTRTDPVALTHGHMPEQRDIVLQNRSATQLDIWTDNTKRTDHTIVRDLGVGMDIGQFRYPCWLRFGFRFWIGDGNDVHDDPLYGYADFLTGSKYPE